MIFSARDYELVRNQVELGEIIGEGQFGDVHKGIFKGRDNQSIPVAVKTCKADADLATAEKFLEEACEYYNSVWHTMCKKNCFMIKNVFKRRKECGTYLATARRHRWRVKMTMKNDK